MKYVFVEIFIKEHSMKYVLWLVACTWVLVDSLLKNGWHKLLPALIRESNPDETVI